MSQEFRLKNIDETRNYFLEEIKKTELMSKKPKTLSYFSFYNYWMYFKFYFCFLAWYSYTNYKFCNRIKNLCNNCRN